MPQCPVCYFAFANARDGGYLQHLKKESRAIRSALQSLHDRQVIEVRHEESVETDFFFEDISRLAGRELAIFHFSGHGDSTVLFAEDGATTADSTAGLLAAKKDSLGVVVLNACSTAAQVRSLHDNGIPAVIATSRPVQDVLAMDFSVAFYGALANGYNLEGAFLHAAAFLRRKPENKGMVVEIHHMRGFGNRGKELPWGLYLHPEMEGALKWKLPVEQRIPVPPSYTFYSEVNQGITAILEAMAGYQPILAQMEMPPKVLIVQNFPWVISTNIRRLFANEKNMNRPSLLRLREQIQAYVAGTRLLAFILLSQLWDALQDQAVQLETDWDSLWNIREDNCRQYDYVVLLKRIYAILQELNIPPFVPELKETVSKLEEGGASYEGYRLLESVRAKLMEESIPAEEVRQTCLEVETCLTQFLSDIAFLARYRLLAVKDIRVVRPKHEIATFHHQIFKWNVVDKSLISDTALPFPEFTDSHSVLLVEKPKGREFERINRFLNLSPFYIDKSTFFVHQNKPQLPAIFVFEAKEAEGYRFVTVDYNVNNDNANESDYIRISRQRPEYGRILELIGHFEKDLKTAALRS